MGRRWSQRNEDLVIDRIRRDRVRAGPSGHVLDPFVGHRVDDPEDRPGRVVARGDVIVLVAGVVPDLISAADLRDRRDDRAGASVHDLLRGRIAATDEQLLLRAEREPGWTAALDGEEADAHVRARIDDRDRPARGGRRLRY